MGLALDLLKEWDEHNHIHRCYYDSDEYDGYGECPSRFSTLGDFLESQGLLFPKGFSRIIGRELSEPNFRSKNSGSENPVEEVSVDESTVKPLSIRQARINKKPRLDSSYYTPVTDEVLRDRAEKAKTAPVENEQPHWEVMAMEYFKNKIDHVENNILIILSELNEKLDRIEDAVNKAEPVDVEEVLDYGQRFRTIYEGY